MKIYNSPEFGFIEANEIARLHETQSAYNKYSANTGNCAPRRNMVLIKLMFGNYVFADCY